MTTSHSDDPRNNDAGVPLAARPFSMLAAALAVGLPAKATATLVQRM